MRKYDTLLRKELDSLRKIVPLQDSVIQRKLFMIDSVQSKYLEFQKYFNEFQEKKPSYEGKVFVDSFYKRLLNLETKNVKWTRFRLQWWDIEVDLNGKKYNLFNKDMPLDSQFSKKNFTQWSFGISFNRFSSKSEIPWFNHGVFVKLSYAIANDNNLSNEETKEIRTTQLIDTPNFRREIIGKVNAYDIPFKSLYSHNFKTQISKYLNERKTNAISFYTSMILSIKELKEPLNIDGKPDITAGLGYLLGFLDKDKEKNIINIEIFLNFSDILNSAEKESNFLARHQLGLKFGVPFNSIFINQK